MTANSNSLERPHAASGRALLDTTVQVDRVKFKSRSDRLQRLLEVYELRFATSISLVEFKATVIAECIVIHNQMRRKGARFTQARDWLLEKHHRQLSLRSHIFNNLVNIFANSSFAITEEEDELLAEKARLALENVIPMLYHEFSSDQNIDALLKDKLGCDRAREAPSKKKAAFSPNLPNCRRGQNKACRVEELIRSEGVMLIERLRTTVGDSEQLRRAIELFDLVIRDRNTELSVDDCRRAGDCLIALEAAGSVTHALSSNAREWKPISEASGFEFVHVTYPEERSR